MHYFHGFVAMVRKIRVKLYITRGKFYREKAVFKNIIKKGHSRECSVGYVYIPCLDFRAFHELCHSIFSHVDQICYQQYVDASMHPMQQAYSLASLIVSKLDILDDCCNVLFHAWNILSPSRTTRRILDSPRVLAMTYEKAITMLYTSTSSKIHPLLRRESGV